MGKLDGKVAFITGAARGQGRSHALRLAQEGADIIAVDICAQVGSVGYPLATPEDLAETVQQVEALDRRIVASQADVRDSSALTEAVDEGVAQLGRLDIVLANAGIASFGPVTELTDEMWDDMIDINLTGVFKTVRAAVPHLRAHGQGGAIVLTSSTAGIKGNPIGLDIAGQNCVVAACIFKKSTPGHTQGNMTHSVVLRNTATNNLIVANMAMGGLLFENQNAGGGNVSQSNIGM